jgi:hypothetical protein
MTLRINSDFSLHRFKWLIFVIEAEPEFENYSAKIHASIG